LRDMQLANGAWPWWSGMMPSRWITQHIVAGSGHLEALKATGRGDGQTQEMLRRAILWLDQESVEDHARMTKRMSAEEMKAYRPGYTELHYLYARSFFQRWPLDGQAANVARFYQERAAAHWLEYGLQEQAMIALLLDRSGDRTVPGLIMESLKQRATKSEELGMYWKDFVGGIGWNSFPTETHALMIEAFDEVAKDEASVNALRTYLLKLKQTTDWKTTKATAEACYALLLTGDTWLDEAAAPGITVGNEAVKADKQEAGTGAIEQTWTAERIKPGMGAVTITSKENKPSWGALHWQYFESMDKVKPHESPFSLKKQVMLTRQGDSGPKLLALEGQKLKAGDKLTIRIELRTDRYVDYVHMKDLRAAGLEPTETLSGYKYQGGLGYYQSIRDASTNFFFDRIAPGTYVFEYALRVTHQGEFSNGITTAMCMYAPEFSSHSEGVRFKVEGE
ncbi:MAG: alpha-2-macroglobulin, partial [Flavobacteriales bacterium]|nr:alpha-2-macroglobulin [Flavobacteriales bacterium]